MLYHKVFNIYSCNKNYMSPIHFSKYLLVIKTNECLFYVINIHKYAQCIRWAQQTTEPLIMTGIVAMVSWGFTLQFGILFVQF